MNYFLMAVCATNPGIPHPDCVVPTEQASPKLVQLKHWLQEHAPHLLHQTVRETGRGRTGVPELDRQIGSVWPESGVVEWVRSCPSTGATALLLHLASHQKKGWIAWVDCNQLDPASCPSGLVSRLLWVRARDGMEVVRAGELLVRDGNVAWVVLDLGEDEEQARVRVPASVWFRLGQVTRQSGRLVVVMTSRARVSGARLRVRFGGARTVEDIDTDFCKERMARAAAEGLLGVVDCLKD
ncbi:MAG: hypothetical protein OHK005_14500 [Candidatus Methylacidiphilales bacterium]